MGELEEQGAVQRVPQELLEEIFSYASEGKANLTSYSLVCRAWTWPTRPYLFRVLNIDTIIRRGTQRDADKQTTSAMSSAYFAKSTAQSIARFIAFLEAHPPIALLYQRFLIGSRPWVDPVNSVVDDTIAQCLELTRNIRDLDAITTDAPYSKALQKAVVRKLRSSVTILSMVQDMVGMPLVAAAIREAPHLRELRVTVRDRLTPIVRAQESAADPTDHAHTRPVLRALVVGKATHDLPPWLVSANCPAALSALRELTIHESTLHVASVHAPLLAAVGATLRALTLVSWDLDFSVDFGALPALRRLRVCGMSLRAVSAGRAALVFKQLPRAPAPQLEHVELVFTPVRAMDERMKPVRAWQDFGELLAGPGLEGLKSIVVVVDDRVGNALLANSPRAFRARPPGAGMHGEDARGHGSHDEPLSIDDQERRTTHILRDWCPKLVQRGLL